MTKFRWTKDKKGKRVPVCDMVEHHFKDANGKRVITNDIRCTNKAYRECYYGLKEKGKIMSWSYLCRKHFEKEEKAKKIDSWCGV
jgi:hypothetical protein